MRIDQVTVIGLGLIGGSLAWKIKDKKLARVVGYARREETIKEALDKGIIDEGTTDLINSIKNSNLIMVCTSIDSVTDIVKEISVYLRSDAIVVDVGSTKKKIVYELSNSLPEGVTFIGGHPMAGSEKSGIDAADKNLFDGAKFILTPYKTPDNQKIIKLNYFIEKLGMKIEYLSPDEHDLAVAAISHLPYLMAATLVNTIGTHENSAIFLRVAASGFKDTTRVSSSPSLWGKDVCVTNKDQILLMINAFKDNLNYMESLIKLNKEKELLDYFENAIGTRKKLTHNGESK
ncbi:MAG: prephenate dehydrogenase [Candidatus Margulisiibacteriota bacterium]|nr:MAG: hypothetical protein A2X43_11420 [Candidatus Margulisbacteria bacterium GWD2_39_127]OGI03724.1 MAG: hypothetical protein A2X42_06620 [Candidatus Margulisbacteria bacterium GWF2_38_17]OGI06844.1 MAG: hypothetical protein A2X41_12640 [Candidatus Margulisbacteria bacterium GWE2_39_32]PZM77061.1 MAG: prephenate dehydrogenase [Candidatus Margulisiibacteriota bacterium]HAR64439.1 prephenate dehydrogenase/arogenate dehydrogenase family protein [Candidatus Margulisiibacteriota bacterium]